MGIEVNRIVKLKDLVASPFNPRKSMNEKELKELAESIKTLGILQPILVREAKDPAMPSNKLEIVFGHRRAAAAEIAGLTEIPAQVRDLTNDEAMEAQVIENLQRKEITPIDEANGFKQLLKTGRYKVEDLAAKFGKGITYIRTRIRLAALPLAAQKAIDTGELPLTAALELAKLPEEIQAAAFKKLDLNAAPSTIVDEIRQEFYTPLSEAMFDVHDAELVKKAGACDTCTFRSGNHPDLFDEVKADVCTRSGCFTNKTKVHFVQLADELAVKGATVVTGKKAEQLRYGTPNQMVDLSSNPSYTFNAPGSKSWTSWLGKEGLAAVIPKSTIVVLDEGRHDKAQMKTFAPIATVMAAIKEKGIKWATQKRQTTASGQPKISAAQKAKEAMKGRIQSLFRIEVMRRAGEATVGIFGALKPETFMLAAFTDEIENHYMDDSEEKEIAIAFGENPEAEGAKYIGPISPKRLDKMPFKDLSRMIGIMWAHIELPRDPMNVGANYYKVGRFASLGINMKKLKKALETQVAAELKAKSSVPSEKKGKGGK